VSRLDEIKARAEAATPGPWHAWDRGIGWEVHKGEERAPCGRSCDELNGEFRGTFTREDAAFIAAAREDVPWLVSEVERLTAERDALAAQVARLAKPGDPDARMCAYYYGFTRTGIGLVDNILSAVAKAGKSYHGTDMWGEELIEGGTCESRIQDAADAAAEQIRSALSGSEADTTDTQPTDQEDQS
jgi:hypothetical protein